MASRISWAYVAHRLVASLFTIWVILTLVFLILKALPGDYVSVVANSPQLTAAQQEALRRKFGLGGTLFDQYVRFVQNYATLDFGRSFSSQQPVWDIIAYRLPRTYVLLGVAATINFIVGILAGIHFGWLRGSKVDQAGFVSGIGASSIPFFWLGWMLLLIFSYSTFGVQWFPTQYMTTSGVSEFTWLELVTTTLHHLALPVLTLSFIGWAVTMLVMRTSMQEVLGQEYIETARAKGLAPTTVKYKHASRNALIPVTTGAIIALSGLIDGAVVVETVFNWPGMGLLLIESLGTNDFPVTAAVFFLIGVTVVVLRFVTDIVYTYLDPRIKFGEEA